MLRGFTISTVLHATVLAEFMPETGQTLDRRLIIRLMVGHAEEPRC